jgi:hypothetical protein
MEDVWERSSPVSIPTVPTTNLPKLLVINVFTLLADPLAPLQFVNLFAGEGPCRPAAT